MEMFPTQKPRRKTGGLGHLEGGYKLPEVNSENVKKTMEVLSSIFKELPDAEQAADWLFKGGICKKLLELGKEIEENTPEDVKETAGKIAGGILGGAFGQLLKWQA